MTRIICVANQKGGVGKTTSAITLAAYMALAGQRTLVVDLDSQGNSSSVLAGNEGGDGAARSLLAGGQPQASGRDNLWLLPSGDGAVGPTDGGGRARVRQALEKLSADFDQIVLDCPPSLSGLTTGAMLACDELLIPIQSEYYALEGLGQILGLMAELHEEGFTRPGQLRILLCMHDEDLRLCRDVAKEVRDHLGEQVLATAIPRDVALATAPSHRQTIIEHQPLSPGSLAYLAATKELLHGR